MLTNFFIMYHSKITGLGYYVPENIVSNDDLSKIMDTNDEWIQERTGIKERRHVNSTEDTTTSMGVKAAEMAIQRSGLTNDDIDFVVFATLSPDYYFPGSGVLVQEALQIPECPAMDIRMQCSGFVYAVATADQFIKTGMYKNVLVIGSEYHSGGLDMTTRGRNISVIFGDGAGAVLFEPSENDFGYENAYLRSDGSGRDSLNIKAGGSLHPFDENTFINGSHNIIQDGQTVFKNAVKNMADASEKVMIQNKLSGDDIAFLLPHQANKRIIDATSRRMNLSEDRVLMNIEKYGNTTSATLPLLLSDYESKFSKGDKLLFAAFGGGFTWGAVYLTWNYNN